MPHITPPLPRAHHQNLPADELIIIYSRIFLGSVFLACLASASIGVGEERVFLACLAFASIGVDEEHRFSTVDRSPLPVVVAPTSGVLLALTSR